MFGDSDFAQEWGPFGRPLFDDAAARKLSRVGVVDVGSNSVRLVVFDGAARSPAYFYNEKIMCTLGAGLSDTGRLNPEGRKRALSAIRRFQDIAANICHEPLTAVATAAVREAEDGPEFCDEVLQATGLKIHVIDGEEEARLSAQGVLLGWPGSYGLVCDIGGSSMELAEMKDGEIGKRVSSALGPLKLRDVQGGEAGRKAYIDNVLDGLQDKMGDQQNRLFLVGGSWRAIARIDMERRHYPLRVLHEYRMSTDSIRKTAAYINAYDPEELRQRCGVSALRMSLIPMAAEVLIGIVDRFAPHDIAISSYGIREGMLYEQMPAKLRKRDPLIEACRFAENKDARLPGFGKALYQFVLPLFPEADADRQRLIKAACLLHDVSWRAHPDYRAETCFDYATRANLGGLSHEERVFLGLALLHRYRNKREGTRFEDMFSLLSPEEMLEAEILGKAMRFGAMLWMKKDAETGHFDYNPAKKALELTLPKSATSLFGEVAEARLMSLASTMGADLSVVKD
ncbi:Ppx/GppA family phosphatase [Cognatishimia maritima]|uniref:Exopolyphosphatase / guanosine-5'-triphosphate,3'-diphosphate pyrophosphatase n=1 Tax=Cognatishimia maritima TaxID=870908 RepID=A0A1M5JRQ8_9RHOB|nr:Ppx/GppA family phosphatase [Cognatishimia maritima]SHG42949.1 exopolyphosphatase / guanosine-5'-triphosphate,3'-diphosphate pyrophosphatase [Cognatishimia maritima]